jgi:hypothetical protein
MSDHIDVNLQGVNESGSTPNLTLTEHWDGTNWSVVASPNPSSDDSLNAVNCVASADCWTVGTGGSGQTLTEHWDGSHWSIVPSANAGVNSVLNAVTCVATADCWAVGYYTDVSGTSQTLTEHWDGNIWSIVASADAGTGLANTLQAINCVASADCWAVGYYANGSNVNQTLSEHYAVAPGAGIPDLAWAPGLVLVGAVLALLGLRRRTGSRKSDVRGHAQDARPSRLFESRSQ